MEKRLEEKNLKIAIQKDGRLTDGSLEALRLMGLDLESYSRRLFATCRNFPVEVLFCRDDDIPGYVQSGIADIGIVGQNILKEANVEAKELIRPGFGYCQIAVAVPKESKFRTIQDLQGKKIATSFPNITREYFKKHGVDVEITLIAGAVEITPALGVADAITDISGTGSTLLLNDLRRLDTIMETEAVMIESGKKLSQAKQELVTQMITRLEGVIAAKSQKYIMMNAPKTSLEDIKKIAPGLSAPTVMELTRPDWVAIHAVMEESTFWEVANDLKALGAEGILVLPIEKMIA